MSAPLQPIDLDLRDLISWVFRYFQEPHMAGDLPDTLIPKIRRLEAYVDTLRPLPPAPVLAADATAEDAFAWAAAAGGRPVPDGLMRLAEKAYAINGAPGAWLRLEDVLDHLAAGEQSSGLPVPPGSSAP